MPTYFPFCVMAPGTAGFLRTLWRGARIILPTEDSRSIVERIAGVQDFLAPYVPAGVESSRVEEAYRACMRWKEATLGADLSFAKIVEHGTAPFFDENTVSYLRSDILRHVSLQRRNRQELLFSSMVFLRLALDHDVRQIELAQEMETLGKRERELFALMRGGEDENGGPVFGPVARGSGAGAKIDLGEQMTGERIAAWAVAASAGPLPPGMLVTDSKAVFEHLSELFSDLKHAATISGIPDYACVEDKGVLAAWQEELASYFGTLASSENVAYGEQPPSLPDGIVAGNKAVLSVFVLSGVGVADFFKKAASAFVKEDLFEPYDGMKNMVIGLLSF